MYILIAFSVLITTGSVLGILFPTWLLQQVKAVWQTKGAMYFAVVFRILLGTVLILYAPHTEFPMVFRILGILGLVAAVGLPLLGWQRVDNLLAWFESRPRVYIRTSCVLGLLLGVFVAYGVM